MDCPPGQKKVTLLERWPFVQVQLYNWNEHRADWVLILYEVQSKNPSNIAAIETQNNESS